MEARYRVKIFEAELTQPQIEAGLKAMSGRKGEFGLTDVSIALRKAGAKNVHSGAEVLVARELRLGHIRRITRGLYVKV